MSQRQKARAFAQREGIAGKVSTRLVPKSAAILNVPHRAADGAGMGPDGLASGGMVRPRMQHIPIPKMIPKPVQNVSPMGAPGPDPGLASPKAQFKRGGCA